MARRSKKAEYLRLNGKYLKEAEALLARGDHSQALEKFWGAVAEMVKAVAESRGRHLKTRADLFDFVRKLDADRPDLQLAERFLVANSLHSNFYEDELPGWAVEKGAQAVRELVERLKGFL